MKELVPGLVLTTPIKHKEACKLYALKPTNNMTQLIDVEEKTQDFLSDVSTDVDLRQGDATALTIWIRSYLQEANTLHTQKMLEKDKECGQGMKDFMAMCNTANAVKVEEAVREERESYAMYLAYASKNLDGTADGYIKAFDYMVEALTSNTKI